MVQRQPVKATLPLMPQMAATVIAEKESALLDLKIDEFSVTEAPSGRGSRNGTKSLFANKTNDTDGTFSTGKWAANARSPVSR